jgi:hypothetical protein
MHGETHIKTFFCACYILLLKVLRWPAAISIPRAACCSILTQTTKFRTRAKQQAGMQARTRTRYLIFPRKAQYRAKCCKVKWSEVKYSVSDAASGSVYAEWVVDEWMNKWMTSDYEALVEWSWHGKKRHTVRNTCHSATLYTTALYRSDKYFSTHLQPSLPLVSLVYYMTKRPWIANAKIRQSPRLPTPNTTTLP